VKISRTGRAVERVYLEAFVMGLCIGVAAMLLDYWVGYGSWPLRIVTLLLVGGGLCVFQYRLARFRRRS